MDADAVRRRGVRLLTALAFAAGIAALLLLARSVENSAQFSRWQPWILSVNIGGAIALAILLARKIWQLYRDFRDHVPGSRLTTRTVLMFGSLVIAPLVIVYLFSLDFLNRGIDSWFQVEIKQGLNDALVLSRAALNLQLREQARRTDIFADSLRDQQGAALLQRLDEERRATDAKTIVVYDPNGRAAAVSSAAAMLQQPAPPPPEVTLQLASGRSYSSLDPQADGRYTIETAAAIGSAAGARAAGRRYVLIEYEVPKELSALAEAVQNTSSQYGDLSTYREPLKISFQLTLTLVVLLTLLAAIYGAIYSAQRLTRPVQDLIAGTRAVGKGDFDTRLPLSSRDEMGFLVHSFNDMTKRLRRASEEALRSRQTVERERERLSIILSRLSTGVIVTDRELTLRSANQSAGTILGSNFDGAAGHNLAQLATGNDRLSVLSDELRSRLQAGWDEWREQLTLPGESGERVLLWACTPLPDESEHGGVVVVFDDITALLAAQRDAAWGEVARRLAHEIKNPLTPIQLSAEQLRRKLLAGMNAEDAQLLERATRTIVQQVDAMKQMVNAFSEYARAAYEAHAIQPQSAGRRGGGAIPPAGSLGRNPLGTGPQTARIEADRGRVRQILANLITNGIEALSGVEHGCLEISTRQQRAEGAVSAVICVRDNGPGFRKEILGRLFDPYVTGKLRGTGLGLAIVKRIVEEHGGRIEAENRPEGGAKILVYLPVGESDRALLAGGERRMELRRERA